MPALKSSVPSHLSIFVTDPDSGRPVPRLPLYAEVAVPRIVPVPPINERFHEPIRAVLIELDPAAAAAASRDRIETAALQALAETVEKASSDQLVIEPARVRELFYEVFKEVLRSANRERMADIPSADLKPLIVAAVRRVGPQLGLRMTPEAKDTGMIWADPLGVLTTDHVGYVSFDLKRLRPDVQVMLAEAIEARRTDPDAVSKLAIWVYPYGQPGRFDVLNQARFAFDAVVARLSMTWNTLPPALINMGPRALQNPSLTDWRLSPASFAASPKTLIGENGCEELVPANLALQEFVLRQVVRLTDVPSDFGVPPGFKTAYVDDYKVTWFSLGHSLGEILYSLPLAPGETVKLAVIDWSWDNLTKRDENTKLSEEVLHQTHRDRIITETVKAGLKELQHGSSFMGGTASAAGASGGANLGVVGLGAAVGNTWSLGGSTATSDGSRDLAAENVQRLSDSFSQASSAQREINSTVVIQARQEEKESIQTRTFSNYNHSHTLTILYYEVLRHFRVTVEWVRRRPAVLVARTNRTWTAEVARKYRALLEPAVFDPKAKAGFDALEQLLLAETDDAINAKPAPPQVIQQRDWKITSFLFTVEVGEEETTSGVHIEARLNNGTTIPLLLDGNPNINKDELFNNDGTYPIPLTPQLPVKWGELVGIDIYVSGDDNLDLPQIGIEGMGAFPKIILRPFSGPQLSFIDADKRQTLGVNPAGPDIPVPPAPPTGKQRLTPEQNAALARLLEHLAAFPEYYESVLYLGLPADDLAAELAAIPWAPGSSLLDHVDPMPLATFGNHVAYPLARTPAQIDDTLAVDIAAALNGNDVARRQWALDRLAAMNEADREKILVRVALASAKSERLISLPTRGVFAEGKLGHCNISEEIDNTRFWKWEEHPIPIEAPDINPVTPIQPQPQQVNAAPTPFPQSLVNIVNPSPAPDPSGLTAALSLLGTPNIFRDMSGRQEVADLLKKLSDNSIAIAEAANRAREIQAKYGTDLDKQKKEYDQGVARTNADVEKSKLELEKEKARQVTPSEAQDAIKLSESEMRKGNKTPEEHKELSKNVQNNQKGAQPVPPTPKKKKIQFNLKGWGDTNIVGQWRLDLDQRGTAVAFVIETSTNATGVIVVEVPNEFGDNRYSVSIAGEVLGGFGINAVLKVRNLIVEFPPDKYKANDYLYVTLKASTDKFHTKASDSDEVTKKFSEHIGVSPEIGYKEIIKVTGEGGWTWEREGKKTAGREMEMDVYYYTGGFTVDSIS